MNAKMNALKHKIYDQDVVINNLQEENKILKLKIGELSGRISNQSSNSMPRNASGREVAASKIQRMFKNSNKKASPEHTKEPDVEYMEAQARIQRRFNEFKLQKKMVRSIKAKAANVIQTKFRKNKMKEQLTFQKTKESTIVIQRAFRRYYYNKDTKQ